MLEMRDELFERGFSGYIHKKLSNVLFSNYIFISCFIGVLVVGATDAFTAGTRNVKNTIIEIIMTRYLTMHNLFSSINFFHRKLEIRVQMDSYHQFIHPDG